ncbi:MAG TPA: mechanosensitive ion channel [Candidatus Rifleibacterium sp.]|nr:mechanosensitive ion channel [Candidatus Rifleibacterium sp.]HPT47754.1 mechanosensitive ion channel [Candidatus Rifleibacterium sp.]
MPRQYLFLAKFCLILLILHAFFACQPATAQMIDLSQFIGPLPLQMPAINASTTPDNANDSMAEVLPKAEALKDEVDALYVTITELTDVSKLLAEHKIHKEKLHDQQQQFVEVRESGSYGFEKISGLRSEIRALIDAIGRHARYISERLVKSETLKQKWAENEKVWQNQKNALPAETGSSLHNVVTNASEIIAVARGKLEGIEAPLVNFQQQVIELQRETQKQLSDIDRLMSEMRKDLFRKSRPAMFTPTFVMQFDKALWEEFWLGIASFELPDRKFFQTFGWVLFLQIFFIAGTAWFLRSQKDRDLDKFKLGFIVARPWSASFLLGLLVPMPLFESVPKLFQLLFAGLISISSARLIGGLISLTWRRRLLYFIVTLYLTIQLFTFIALPAPAMRVFTAAVGLAGAMLCFWRARVNQAEGRSMTFVAGVKTGGASLAMVFLSQAAGYVAFSNHLLDVTIKTVFIGVVAWMINLVLRGIVDALFDNSFVRKYDLINRHYHLFIKRTSVIIDTVVVFFALAAMLSIWGFFDSIWLAAENLLAFGISLEGYRLSLGMLIWAIVIVYASLTISWLLQRLLEEEVYPRRKVERGVGISINRLIHYAFIVLAVTTGLSTIGIGLQNLTVIVGALGIGIGFGLQNIVNNFASGIIMLFERSIKVGDIVQIKGEWGTIKNLGLRATVVETFDRSEMIVPNSDLVSSTVINWTLSDRQTRLIIQIGVAYGSDVQKVTQILLRIAQENPFVMKFPEPAVYFMNFGSSSLDFELRAWVADIDVRLKVKNEINYEIERLFRENSIEIPFPQHDLHIRSIDGKAEATLKKAATDR